MNQKSQFSFLTLGGVTLVLLAGLLSAIVTLQPNKLLAQDIPGITSPASGNTVNGVVSIIGTATSGSFQRYELYYKPADAGDEAYIYISESEESVFSSELGTWDTTDLEPDLYDLRMRVVRLDGNYAEYFATELQVQDESIVIPTATPTVTTVATATTPISATVVTTITPSITETTSTTPTVAETAASTATATITVTAEPTVAPTEVSPAESDETAQITTLSSINVRSGPGTDYDIVSGLNEDAIAPITGKNADETWWQIQIGDDSGWVLAQLVTADNVDDVPVIEVAPPPTPEAETEGTDSDEEEAPEEQTPEEEAPEDTLTVEELIDDQEESEPTNDEATASAPLAANTVVTVALAEADNADTEAFRTFVRAAYAVMGLQSDSITVSVGVLPASLPVSLTIPPTATIIGGLAQTGEFENSQIFLSSPDSVDALVTTMRQQLTDAGYTAAPVEFGGGPGEVFVSTRQIANPLIYCAPDDATTLALSTLTVAGNFEILGLSIDPASGFGGPCGDPSLAMSDNFSTVLPRLLPPAASQVLASGGGSGSSPDGFNISAQADIESQLSATELADHYIAQLETAGWTQLDVNQVDNLHWSAWSFTDEDENEWNATFYIVQQGGEDDGYIATLRAETEG